MRSPSSRILRSTRATAAVAVLTLAAGCGDDGDDTAGSDTGVLTRPAATAASAGTDAAGTTAAPAATEAAATSAPAGATPGGGLYGEPVGETSAAAPGGTGGTDATGAADAAGATVAVAESDLGSILVDGEGRTLYLFLPDGQGPSTCTDACLEAWPALAGPVTAGEGVDESLLGTAERTDDGSAQATYNGWPLYYYAADASPGDVNGQGVGDVWFVLDPAGEPVPAD